VNLGIHLLTSPANLALSAAAYTKTHQGKESEGEVGVGERERAHESKSEREGEREREGGKEGYTILKKERQGDVRRSYPSGIVRWIRF
jgi:hypothetical protein